ncbi:MAG TPA: hypothetical protein P5148_04990 [Anaerolineae bacterium]|nr:hypothetical protein [Anaerolineae bacterium]
MEPITLYLIAALLFVLGLAAAGGAIFGRKRGRRIALGISGLLLWSSALAGCNQANTTATATATATAQPSAISTPSPVVAQTATQPVASPTAPPSPVDTPDQPVDQTSIPQFLGRIVFHSDRDGDLDIYSMNADGSDLQQLTDSPGRDFEPDWSPDGSTIVFSSDRDDPTNAQLYLMDADGSNQRPLMPFTPADYLGARWSPDGEWILFHSNLEVDGVPWFNIYKVRKDGSELTDLTGSVDNSFRPDWSPDGQRIVFTSERDGNREIYVMNADGSNPVRLTDNIGDDNQPRWSPDGSQILFESNRDGANMALYLMDAPSTDVTGPQEQAIHLLSFPGFNSQSASWADGGKLIVYSSDRDSALNENWDVYIMPADASAIYRLTTEKHLDRFPVWTGAVAQ